MAERPEYDLHVKLLMIGDTGVGKTCMLLRYAYDNFSPTFITTIGIDFKIKFVDIEGTRVKLQIWDTAGQERFRTITTSYFKGAHGVMLVYDVTDRETFEAISDWLAQTKEHAGENVNVVLVGNKCDMVAERTTTTEEGRALAKEYGLEFFETSAKENTNVDETYLAIATATKRRLVAEGGAQTAERAVGNGGGSSGGGGKNKSASVTLDSGERSRRKCC